MGGGGAGDGEEEIIVGARDHTNVARVYTHDHFFCETVKHATMTAYGGVVPFAFSDILLFAR